MVWELRVKNYPMYNVNTDICLYVPKRRLMYRRTSYAEDDIAAVDEGAEAAAVTVVGIISMGNRRPPLE